MDISVEKEWDEIFPSESSPNSMAPNSPDSMLIVTSSLSVFTGTCFSMSFSARGKTVCRLCHLLIHSPLIRTLYPGCEEPVCSAYSPSALPTGNCSLFADFLLCLVNHVLYLFSLRIIFCKLILKSFQHSNLNCFWKELVDIRLHLLNVLGRQHL